MYKVIGVDGKEYGPVSADVLRQWLAQGRINSQTRVLPEGATEWKMLQDLPEFAPTPPGAAPAGPAGPAPLPITPAVIVVPEQRRTNSLAITGLALGIFSLTFGLCCCSGLPFSLAGAICSGIALSQIKQDPAQQGRGLAIAGLIVSIVGLLVGVLIMVVYGALSSFPDLMRKIQRL